MGGISALSVLVAGLLAIGTAAFLRVLYMITSKSRKVTKPAFKSNKSRPLHLAIVLGSGGHTAEMLSLLRSLNPTKYSRRTYIVSSGDTFSATKAEEYERSIQSEYNPKYTKPSQSNDYDSITGIWDVQLVPRARRIHQPLYTAPFSSLQCLFGCLLALSRLSKAPQLGSSRYPDAIVTNGPATAVIVILAGILLKFFGLAPLWKMKTIYVESWARVKTLSLSGKLLLYLGLCDRFIVQWEGLAKTLNENSKIKKVEWVGFLVE